MVLLAIPVLVLDLTASDGGLVEGGMTGQWEWGVPTVGPVGLGRCWATNLDADYLHDTIDTLDVPLPSLAPLTRPVLVLRHWYDISTADRGHLEVDDGSGFATLDPIQGYPGAAGFTGVSGGYVEHAWDLTGFGATPQVRFVFEADAAIAAPGWALQDVTLWDGDIVAPTVSAVTSPVDTQDLAGPYEVVVDVVDDVVVASVVLDWTSDRGAGGSTAMMDLGGGQYRGEIPGQPPDTVVNWSVTADDGEQTARWPPTADEAFRVFLAAPTDLAGPAGSHLVAKRVELTWTPPVSPHPVLVYHVHQDGQPAPLIVPTDDATLELTLDQTQIFQVRAVYDVGQGDLSEPVELDIEVPDLHDVDPTTAYQGDRLYLNVVGSSLYMLQDLTELTFGAQIAVLSLDVIDANSATALIEVPDDAEIGPVDVSVKGTVGRITFEDAFEVRSGDDRPRILRITPAALRQGDDVVVEAQATQPFAGAVTVDGGEDLFLTGPVVTSGDLATFPMTSSTRARVGRHTLLLDDGERLWPVDVQVDEYVAQLQTGCGSGRSGAGFGLVLLVALRRRRQCPALSPHSSPSRASRPHPVR